MVGSISALWARVGRVVVSVSLARGAGRACGEGPVPVGQAVLPLPDIAVSLLARPIAVTVVQTLQELSLVFAFPEDLNAAAIDAVACTAALFRLYDLVVLPHASALGPVGGDPDTRTVGLAVAPLA